MKKNHFGGPKHFLGTTGRPVTLTVTGINYGGSSKVKLHIRDAKIIKYVTKFYIFFLVTKLRNYSNKKLRKVISKYLPKCCVN